AQHPDMIEALFLEPRQRPPKLPALPSQHVWPELAILTRRVALLADRFRNVERDRDRQRVVLAGERDERSTSLQLGVRGIDDRQPACGKPLPGDVMERLERVGGR